VIQPGRYRFVPSRSTASVTAFAPGHRFTAKGMGIEGTVELAADRVLSASARFPLEALDAGDMLGNRELRKFLSLDQRPIALAELIGEVKLDPSAQKPWGTGTVELSIGRRTVRAPIRLEGDPAKAGARFQLSFTGLSYEPPKLLFLRVKDAFDVDIEAALVLDETVR
jgi:hypothetical protein